VVPLGHSIQKAINESPPGTVIVLEPGVYKQSVQIRKDEITIQGAGAFEEGTIMVPPDQLPPNLCRKIAKGTGVCVLATHFDHGQIVKTADNDRVSGILFDGGWNFGVFGYGTTGLQITNNGAENYREYGFARFASSGGVIENNEARGLDGSEAGVYVGDSPDAHAVIRGNEASGSLLGVFVRHSHGVQVAYNHVEGNCQGIFILDDGEPGGAGDANIHDNVAHANNLFCPPGEENPPAQGGGILLMGAVNSTVSRNTVLGNSGEQFNSGGIVLLSAAMFGGSDVMNNVVNDNSAYSNHPADIIYDGSGSGNVFTNNHCDSSDPAGLCV
jgi:nitrous oxidase accessory protein NosD